MQVYNTLTKKVEKFVPIDENEVKLYCCGPTVYDFVHIGNVRTFIFYDIMRRTLLEDGFKVKQVINLTDVDDKTIKNSKLRGMNLDEFTKKYIEYFFEDIDKVNIKRADVYPRATENIEQMKAIVLGLIERGYAYTAEDGIYYSISKFKDYGKLSGAKVGGGVSRIKNDEYDKENATDFALWKNWTDDDGDVYWDDNLPKGRPGWHIECSAMSLRYLGETLDIHSGGVDLIFPHHENEIAQSEAYNDKKFVNYWAHPEHLLVDGKKMAKSLHNFFTLRDLEKRGFDPMSFRLMMLDAHYRSKLDFTFEALKKYEKTLEDIEIALKRLEKLPKTGEMEVKVADSAGSELEEFKTAMNKDFDTHSALLHFFKIINLINEKANKGEINLMEYEEMTAAIQKMNLFVGILKDYTVPEDISKLADERKSLRLNGKWNEADKKRNVIKEAGFKIIDLPNSDYVIIKDRKYGR